MIISLTQTARTHAAEDAATYVARLCSVPSYYTQPRRAGALAKNETERETVGGLFCIPKRLGLRSPSPRETQESACIFLIPPRPTLREQAATPRRLTAATPQRLFKDDAKRGDAHTRIL